MQLLLDDSRPQRVPFLFCSTCSFDAGLYTGEGGDSAQSTEAAEDDYSDPAGYRGPGGPERREEGFKRTEFFADLLRRGGGAVDVYEDIQPKRYEKNLWNAAWSSVCAMSRSPVSAAVAPAVLPYTLPVVRRTMLEVRSLSLSFTLF